MIDSQLRTSGISDTFVIQRMGSVPREDYVPENARGVAYMDRAVKLADGRHLAAPAVQGFMLQEAKPTQSDTCLVVDCGSQYLTELVRPLVGQCDSVSPENAGDAIPGKNYSLLIIDGAVEQIPPQLAAALAQDARIVTGLVKDGLTRIAVGRKTKDAVSLIPLAEIGMPVLPEFSAPKNWSF
ncbi:protein-L-isoaspartate O-methyltransferase [Altererythrobacter endophyticus]|uniref:Protein-L-isoaspartate O-methyltransferase n=2 Tax=Altericroceibacterium endophyticum TaxID=1808508 RepID=A0A6I4T676_9SPHN|nr:protein-L-isoaspartate O-methyltransferase [Altericroceibacterium endophyticum]MXO65631.1 protein-L-isoaspartate O-methyltransferase [Altericroceibacterium endophyticum]